MNLNEYQEMAMTTCLESSNNPMYMLANLNGEVGEVNSIIAKAIRKGHIVIHDNDIALLDKTEETTNLVANLEKELGDVLWQLSGLCETLGFSLEDVAKTNLAKLASRKDRGVIDGNGDNR